MQNTQTKITQFANRATKWIGSPTSLVVHTIFFVGAFGLIFFGVAFDQILLGMTTIVSFEAIYLSIFIQMTVNQQTEALHEVREDIEEIQEDVGEIQEDIEEIQEDTEDSSTDESSEKSEKRVLLKVVTNKRKPTKSKSNNR